MVRAFLVLALGLTITTSCKSGKAVSDDSGDDGSAAGTGGGDGGGTGDGETPYILEMDSWCYLHSTGDKFYEWIVNVEADDPQGSDTIESFIPDAVTVSDSGGTEVAMYTLVCSEGECLGSFKEAEDNVSCGNADTFTISAMVLDEDGNWSEAAQVTGREGTDASGRR